MKTNKQFEDDLKKHFFIEMKYNSISSSEDIISEDKNIILTEDHGIIPNMDAYLDTLERLIKEKLSQQSYGKYIFRIRREDFPFETFFNTCTITIVLTYSDIQEFNTKSGGYYLSQKSGYKEGGYHVEIRLNLYGDLNTLCEDGRICLSHELTHAYDDFNRRNNGAEDIYHNSLKRGQYIFNKWNELDKQEFVQSIYYICSLTNEIEINAYLAEVKEVVRQHLKKLAAPTMQDAYNAIKESDVYKFLNEAEGEVEAIIELRNENSVYANEIKQKIINTYNSSRSHTDVKNTEPKYKNITTKSYIRISKIIESRFKYLKERFYSQAPKMAFDAYEEHMRKHQQEPPRTKFISEIKRMLDIIKKVEE